MKAGMFLCLLSLVLFKAEAKTRWPEIKFYRIEPTPTTVYYGETTVVRYIMESRYMKNSTQWWTWPQGITSIRTDYNQCPPFYLTTVHMMNYNYCAFSVLVYGSYFGQVIAGSPAYHLTGGARDLSWSDLKKVLPAFAITVIPHPISFTLISQQKGTVNTPFYFDLKSLVNYYQENVNAGVVIRLMPVAW